VARTPSVAQVPPGLPGARPPVQHRASMASYRMTDLREDSRTTIERNRERHRDIEGATSRDTLTCMHQRVRAKLHMHLSP
jgi:hypothetical protein